MNDLYTVLLKLRNKIMGQQMHSHRTRSKKKEYLNNVINKLLINTITTFFDIDS